MIKHILRNWRSSFALLLKIRQKSEGGQNSTLEWSEVDLKVWNASFGGYFYWKMVSDFSSGPRKPLFQYTQNYQNICIYHKNTTPKTRSPSSEWKICNHFLIEIPLQNLHSTPLDQHLTTLKCCFGYTLIFGRSLVIM